MKFHEETQRKLIEMLADWKVNAPGIYSCHSGAVRLHLSWSTGDTWIFLRNNAHEFSGYTRLENWKAAAWSFLVLEDDKTLAQLWIEAKNRIEDFQTAAQVAIILEALGIFEKEKAVPNSEKHFCPLRLTAAIVTMKHNHRPCRSGHFLKTPMITKDDIDICRLQLLNVLEDIASVAMLLREAGEFTTENQPSIDATCEDARIAANEGIENLNWIATKLSQ
jgi:hypothetical protein